MDIVFTLLTFLLVISVIVFIHELGHFFVARWNGVRVEVFSIGFGPKLFSWKDRHGTDWRFSVILLGGYVRMLGDLDAASTKQVDSSSLPKDQRQFTIGSKSVGQRAAIAVAGPAFNLIFAIIVLALIFGVFGQTRVVQKISEVLENSPAAVAGLQPGDFITSINDQPTPNFEQIIPLIQANGGSSLKIGVLRADQNLTVTVTPKINTVTDLAGNQHQTAQIGVKFGETRSERIAPLPAIGKAISDTTIMSGQIFVAVWDMISGQRSPKEMVGLISIAKVTGQAARIGIEELLKLMAIISINLGIVNLLPIPILDGGHLVLCGIEAIRGKPLSQKIQGYATLVGMAIVISLMVFSNGNDIVNAVKGMLNFS